MTDPLRPRNWSLVGSCPVEHGGARLQLPALGWDWNALVVVLEGDDAAVGRQMHAQLDFGPRFLHVRGTRTPLTQLPLTRLSEPGSGEACVADFLHAAGMRAPLRLFRLGWGDGMHEDARLRALVLPGRTPSAQWTLGLTGIPGRDLEAVVHVFANVSAAAPRGEQPGLLALAGDDDGLGEEPALAFRQFAVECDVLQARHNHLLLRPDGTLDLAVRRPRTVDELFAMPRNRKYAPLLLEPDDVGECAARLREEVSARLAADEKRANELRRAATDTLVPKRFASSVQPLDSDDVFGSHGCAWPKGQ